MTTNKVSDDKNGARWKVRYIMAGAVSRAEYGATHPAEPVTQEMIERWTDEILANVAPSAGGACIAVPREKLEEIASALDRSLGDSDITHLETEEEVRDAAPAQWACSEVNKLLNSAPSPEREGDTLYDKWDALQSARSSEPTRIGGWEPIADAPMFVYGRDALVGRYVEVKGWDRVSIWEPGWTRDQIIERGGTHWWPHLRDLPPPCSAQSATLPTSWPVEIKAAFDLLETLASMTSHPHPDWMDELKERARALLVVGPSKALPAISTGAPGMTRDEIVALDRDYMSQGKPLPAESAYKLYQIALRALPDDL